MLFPASFKLALMCCSCLHHLLPWVASYSLVLHHACSCIMHCSCVVCLLCCVLLFDSSCFVAIVRIRSSTLDSASSVHLFHGLVLLPCGISGKMTATLDLTTIIATLVVRSTTMSCYLPLVISCLPYCHVKSLTLLPSKPLIGYVTALLSPSYSVVSCRWRLEPFLVGTFFLLVGISLYCYVILMHLYTW